MVEVHAMMATPDELLGDGDWAAAKEAFRAGVDEDGKNPHPLVGLATASRALGDIGTATSAFDRAYELFVQAGSFADAASVAVELADLAVTYAGDGAIASGWLQRAHHHVRDVPTHPAYATVPAMQSYLALAYDKDPMRARGLAEEAVARAQQQADSTAEVKTKAHLGLVLVSAGEVDAGMRLLDEATAAAAGGELATEHAMDVYCILITACERVRDFGRVHEWARRVMDAASEANNEDFLTFARTEFAHVLVRTGHWDEAERHLRLITDDPEARPLSAAMAYVFLADLFVRRGDLEQADQMLSVAEKEPWRRGVRHLAMTARAALHLAEGRPQDAADLAQRYLRAVQPEAVAERVGVLETLAEASLAVGDLDTAAQAAEELTVIAATVETAGVRAAARQAVGLVADARGDLDTALDAAWDARELYEAAQMHPDAVRTQIEIARLLRMSGYTARAAAQAEQARAAAHDLGALTMARAATEVLEGLRPSQGGPAELTDREVEVLSHVAEGATNQQIADRLVLSVRTIERHLSNIYLKLGATGPSARSIATSYVHRHGLM